MRSGHVAGQNINALQKTRCKNLTKSQSYAPLDIRRHLESGKKIFYEICLIKSLKLKQIAKKTKLTELWSKTQFFIHFEILRHFENL
jgi:hypothetical protein